MGRAEDPSGLRPADGAVAALQLLNQLQAAMFLSRKSLGPVVVRAGGNQAGELGSQCCGQGAMFPGIIIVVWLTLLHLDSG